MIRVALISHSGFIAGAERMLLNLAVSLRDDPDFCPVVLIPGEVESELAQALTAECVEWRPCPQAGHYLEKQPSEAGDYIRRSVAAARTIADLLWSVGADVVLINTLTNLAGPMAARFAGLPYVLWVHGIMDIAQVARPSAVKDLCDSFIAQSACKVVCCSESTASGLKALMAIDAEPVWNWTKPTDTALEPSRPRRICMLSTLQRHKGVEVLLEALALLRAEGLEVGLDVHADGPLRSTLQARADSLGVSPLVEFHGRTNDVTKVYRASAATVMPSFIEPFGMVAIESMSFGTPVIASRVGGHLEIIEDGVSGLLYEPWSARELADRIRTIVSDGGLAERIGRAGQERARLMFSGRQSVKRFKEIFVEVRQCEGRRNDHWDKVFALIDVGTSKTHSSPEPTVSYRSHVGPSNLEERIDALENTQMALAEVQLELQAVRHRLAAISSAATWRIGAPLRLVLRRMPGRLWLRRITRAAWRRTAKRGPSPTEHPDR